MNKILNTIACLAIGSKMLIAGGDIQEPMEPQIVPQIEPQISVPEAKIPSNNVRYDGFYAGLAWNYTRMSEVFTTKGFGATLVAGYYYNQYLGLETRYMKTFSSYRDGARPIIRTGDSYSNFGIYIKPMYPITTGFSVYGLAGYGKSNSYYTSKDYSEKDFQWGLGAKYELSNGVALFADYLNLHSGDNYGGLIVPDVKLSTTSVGLMYTF